MFAPNTNKQLAFDDSTLGLTERGGLAPACNDKLPVTFELLQQAVRRGFKLFYCVEIHGASGRLTAGASPCPALATRRSMPL